MLQEFLTLALDGGELSASRPGQSTPVHTGQLQCCVKINCQIIQKADGAVSELFFKTKRVKVSTGLMLQNSTLWTWQETLEFCEIRKFSWPGQSLPDSQDINFTESDNYFLITATVIAIIIIIIISGKNIYIYWKLKEEVLDRTLWRT